LFIREADAGNWWLPTFSNPSLLTDEPTDTTGFLGCRLARFGGRGVVVERIIAGARDDPSWQRAAVVTLA
jgi:hypothetical protein